MRNVSGITLRSGKYLGESPLASKGEFAEEESSKQNTRPLVEARARASPSEESLTETRGRAHETRAHALLPGDSEEFLDSVRARASLTRARTFSPDQTGVSEPNTRPRPDSRARASADPRPRTDSSARAFPSETGIASETLQIDDEEEYQDQGDFKLRQEDYVRPNFPPLYSEKPPAPFPEALKDTRRPENDKELFETFSKCEVNIPLLKLIKNIPRYAKFLKELCTIKRKQKLKGKQAIQVSERVSAVFQRDLPKKCSDPGMFSIPCVIGETKFDKAMLDLGASINVLPYFLYQSLGLGPLHETGLLCSLVTGLVFTQREW